MSSMTRIPGPVRQDLLDDLIEGLTPNEWRYLRDRLMQRRFYTDVFGKLPLDIALAVAAYLNPLDIVVMRRISKRWHSLLTSDELSKQVALSLWPQQNRLASGHWTEYLNQRLCCQHSLACGRPWSRADYLDETFDRTSGPIEAELCGSTVAWCAPENSANEREHIRLLSLETGRVSQFYPSTRSQLCTQSLAISDVLVGCLSLDGHCEIFEIRTETCYSFRLPSTNYHKLVIQDDKIACISGCSTLTSGDVLSLHIITWDLTSKVHRYTSSTVAVRSIYQGLTFDIKFAWILGDNSIHLVEAGNSAAISLNETGISIFEALEPGLSLDVCSVSEISLQGNGVVASRIIRTDNPRSSWLLASDSPSDKGHSHVSLPLHEIATDWCSNPKVLSRYCWVHSIDTLRRKAGPLDAKLYHRSISLVPISPFSCWMTTETEPNAVKLISWCHDQQTIQVVKPDIPEGETLTDGSDDYSEGGALRGNRRFFIVPYCARIRAYSFDKDFVLANQDVSYRRERDEKAKARKAERENAKRQG